jgi:hypothetical protein
VLAKAGKRGDCSCVNFSMFCGNFKIGRTRTRTGDTMIFRHVPYFTVERRWLPLDAPKLKSGRSRRRKTSENAGSGHGVVVAVVVLTEEALTNPVRNLIGAG